MRTASFLNQVDLELVMANRSVAFWRHQLAHHPKDPFIRPIAERSLEFALATLAHLERTKSKLVTQVES